MQGAAWSIDEEIALLTALRDGKTIDEMEVQFDRTQSALVERLLRLGQLVEKPGRYLHRVETEWRTFTTKPGRTPKRAMIVRNDLPLPEHRLPWSVYALRYGEHSPYSFQIRDAAGSILLLPPPAFRHTRFLPTLLTLAEQVVRAANGEIEPVEWLPWRAVPVREHANAPARSVDVVDAAGRVLFVSPEYGNAGAPLSEPERAAIADVIVSAANRALADEPSEPSMSTAPA